jgi:hypothetical protein
MGKIKRIISNLFNFAAIAKIATIAKIAEIAALESHRDCVTGICDFTVGLPLPARTAGTSAGYLHRVRSGRRIPYIRRTDIKSRARTF